MTIEYVRPIDLRGDCTFAMPPSPGSMQRVMKVLVIGTTLAMSSTSAASALEDPDPRRLASRWTNTGDVLAEVAVDRGFAEAVLEVRRRSGLTWEQLASLFGVDRRSVHLWASGRPLSARNAERLNRVLDVLRRADRGAPSATKAWLLTPTSQGIPLVLLREGRFEDIVAPGATASPPRPAPLSEAAKRARAPRPPEELVGARHDRVHIGAGKLIASVPLKAYRPK
jgi:transcriptional regulator with XRE-family HTH domain